MPILLKLDLLPEYKKGDGWRGLQKPPFYFSRMNNVQNSASQLNT